MREKCEKCDLEVPMGGGKHILGQSKGRHIFGTARVGDRGQIVIPKEARSFYQIKTGDTLLILGDDDIGMIITKPDVLSKLTNTILDQIGKEETN